MVLRFHNVASCATAFNGLEHPTCWLVESLMIKNATLWCKLIMGEALLASANNDLIIGLRSPISEETSSRVFL